MNSRRKRSVAALAAVAALLLTAGGVAYATIPGSGGVINGCYTRSGGSLRVIDASVTSCKSGETSLDWSVQGPQGPTGPAGPQGLAGPQGPAGPQGSSGVSHGYLTKTSDVPLPTACCGIVASASVPGGTYMMWAEVQVGSTNAEPDVACELRAAGTAIPNTRTAIELKAFEGNVSIVSAASLTGSSNTVELDCASSDSTTTVNANLALVPLDALN
jgi:hypothetical protein